jgi:hypothetical protein
LKKKYVQILKMKQKRKGQKEKQNKTRKKKGQDYTAAPYFCHPVWQFFLSLLHAIYHTSAQVSFKIKKFKKFISQTINPIDEPLSLLASPR